MRNLEFMSGYSKVESEIIKRLNGFSEISNKKDIFYEFCFCVLTPQSNAKRCAEAVEILKDLDFYNKKVNNRKILSVLRSKTRFYKNKTKYLFELKGSFENMWKFFDFDDKNKGDGVEIREWIVKNVKGFGYKEASHFLRNIGFKNLAILDRHILRNLFKIGVLKGSPKTVGKKEYFLIEKKFMDFSEGLKIEMDKLDLYFWYNETGEVFK